MGVGFVLLCIYVQLSQNKRFCNCYLLTYLPIHLPTYQRWRTRENETILSCDVAIKNFNIFPRASLVPFLCRESGASLRPRSHVSGYFWICTWTFSLRIQKFSPPHVVFKSNLLVHTYPDSLSARQLIWKVILGSCESFIFNLLQ